MANNTEIGKYDLGVYTMAKIRIVNMMVYGFHGIYEYEREQGQKFYFDVEVVTRDDKAADSDDAKDTVLTASIYSLVKDTVENNRFQLMQALAGHIGDKLIEQYGNIAEVTIKVRKPNVTINGPIDYVEVEVTRKA